jgi:hypothetical protein
MTAEEHNKTLATLYFIYGAIHGLTLVGLLLLVFVVKIATPAAEFLSNLWIAVGIAAFLILFLLVGLLPLVVGIGFRNRSYWVKSVGLPLAAVSLINIPIGTALGIYTFKFFRSEGGVRLYGGAAATANDVELQDAMRGAQPLMILANRVREER